MYGSGGGLALLQTQISQKVFMLCTVSEEKVVVLFRLGPTHETHANTNACNYNVARQAAMVICLILALLTNRK